nr:hypothetical protein [Kribbella soli]
MSLQRIDYVLTADHHNRVSIDAHLRVRLRREVRGRNEHTELTVPDPRNQPGDVADPDRRVSAVALGLKREVEGDPIRLWPDHVLPNRISAAVAAGACDVTSPSSGRDQTPQLNSYGLEFVLTSLEVVADRSQYRLPNWIAGELLSLGFDDGGRGSLQRDIDPPVHPRLPDRRAVLALICPAGQHVIDPRSRYMTGIQYGESRTIILKALATGGAPDSNEIVIA